MTQEKIKVKLPKTVTVLYELDKNKVHIIHDGKPVDVELKQCERSLDWYLKDADLLFKSGAKDVWLHFPDVPSGGMQGFLIASYRKIPDIASNARFGPQRRITYTPQQCDAGLEIEVDASLVEAYRQRVAEEEQE